MTEPWNAKQAIDHLAEKVEDLREIQLRNHEEYKEDVIRLEKELVSKVEFTPFKMVVYGLVVAALTAVANAVVGLVVNGVK